LQRSTVSSGRNEVPVGFETTAWATKAVRVDSNFDGTNAAVGERVIRAATVERIAIFMMLVLVKGKMRKLWEVCTFFFFDGSAVAAGILFRGHGIM
jgi:hypothetical protein